MDKQIWRAISLGEHKSHSPKALSSKFQWYVFSHNIEYLRALASHHDDFHHYEVIADENSHLQATDFYPILIYDFANRGAFRASLEKQHQHFIEELTHHLLFPDVRKIERKGPIMSRSLSVVPPGQEYVDPYLFETGHFESREEYEELSSTAQIKPRTRA
jgi:hypothetical protein